MKKTFIVFLSAILIGASFAIYLIKGIDKTLAVSKNEYEAYLYQVGVFRVSENAVRESKKYSSSIIIKDHDLYRVYIAIAIDKDVQNAYDNFFKKNNISFYKKKTMISKSCQNKIYLYEKLIKESYNESTYFKINHDLLHYYEDNCHD